MSKQEAQEPRQLDWDEEGRISIGREWCVWRHQHLAAPELAVPEAVDLGPPPGAFPLEGLEYAVRDFGQSFTSGRVTQVHCTGERCLPLDVPLEGLEDPAP